MLSTSGFQSDGDSSPGQLMVCTILPNLAFKQTRKPTGDYS